MTYLTRVEVDFAQIDKMAEFLDEAADFEPIVRYVRDKCHEHNIPQQRMLIALAYALLMSYIGERETLEDYIMLKDLKRYTCGYLCGVEGHCPGKEKDPVKRKILYLQHQDKDIRKGHAKRIK